jgi:Bacterial antitoxin of type II TA system, VapB
MLWFMRVTLRLDDKLMRRAVRIANKRSETLDALIERGLRSLLAEAPGRSSRARKRLKFPVSRAGGGMLPGVDLNDSAGLLDRIEGR